jgi:hypothetical protein
VLEFMQYLVKPMVNATLLDPRQTVQPDTAGLIFESNLPMVSLQIAKDPSSGTIARLMAIKFFKSLFTLDPCPIPLTGVIESVSEIINDLKARLRNPSMLQSAVLEFVN